MAKSTRSDWFHSAKWGVFTHFLASPNMTQAEWNNLVNNFDVGTLAQQLRQIGAKYYFITIGQNSGHYCSPNATYNKFVQIVPSKCSNRDLIADLYKALNPLGIKLLVYLPSGAPGLDKTSLTKLAWKNGPYRNEVFQKKWEAIIKEWSLRWGDKVKGWWFDGAYWPDKMYRYSKSPNFSSFAAAARAGNPNSILAFNPGVLYPIINLTEQEDYTAGETNEPWGLECKSRWLGNAQYHVLSYLGSNWGTGNARYSDDEVIRITHNIVKCGGVMTWDIPILPNGHISAPFVKQLIALNQGLKKPLLAQSPRGNLASYKPSKLLNLPGNKLLPANSHKNFSFLGVDSIPSSFAQASDEWAWTYQVDLLSTYLIKKIVVTFGPNFATDYKVAVSRDTKNWVVLAHKTKQNGGKTSIDFPKIEARYIQIRGAKPDGVGQKGGQMSIAELEVYQ